MSLSERDVTEGNEKRRMSWKKGGAMLDGGEMTQIRANTVQQSRQEVYAALRYAANFHCFVKEWHDCGELKPKPKEKWIFVDKKVADVVE